MKGTILYLLSLDATQFEKGLKTAERALKRTGANLQRIGRGLSTYVTAPLVGIGALATKTFMDFEQQMANVKAVSGATEAQFASLSKNAKDLGRSTIYTAAQVAELQLNYSKLGFVPDEITKITKSTLRLAQASGSDLANSATVAGATLRAFGLQAEEMQRVVDVMAKSFSSSAMDLEKFQTAMGVVAPVAKNAGQEIETTAAMLSVLVDRGVDASTAGTGVRNIFLDIAKKGISLEEAMSKINNATNKNAVALDLFGKRGATVATILAENSSEISRLTDLYLKSGGAADKMADIMDNTLKGAFLRMKSAIEGVLIDIGEILKPVVENITVFINKLADKFSVFSNDAKKKIVILAGVLAAGGPLMIALGGLISMAGNLLAVVRSISIALSANPVGAIIAGILAVSAAVLYLWQNWDAVKERISNIDWWRNTLIEMVKFLGKMSLKILDLLLWPYRKLLDLLGIEIPKAEDAFKPLFDQLDKLKTEPKEYEHQFGSFFEAVKGGARDAARALGLMGSAVSGGTKTGGATGTSVAVEGGRGGGGVAGGFVPADAIQTIGFSGFETNLKEGLKNVKMEVDAVTESWWNMSDAVNFIGDSFAGLTDAIGGMLAGSKNAFRDFVGSMLNGLKQIINGLLAQAIAGLIAGESKKGLPGLILASIGIGALTAMWNSKVPKLATGGIVPPGFPGDTYPAMLTSGEMVVPRPIPLTASGLPSEIILRAHYDELMAVIRTGDKRKNA